MIHYKFVAKRYVHCHAAGALLARLGSLFAKQLCHSALAQRVPAVWTMPDGDVDMMSHEGESHCLCIRLTT